MRFDVGGQRLHRVVGLVRGLLGSLVVEVPLHGPPQLPRKDPRVLAALQAIAVRQNVHDDPRSGEPRAAIRSGRQTDGNATSSSLELFKRLPCLTDRISSISD